MILVDTLEKKNDHVTAYFDENGIEWRPQRLEEGDYMIEGVETISVDKKFSLEEVYGNLIQDHKRFRNECIRAQEKGKRLIVLIEEPVICTVEDVQAWSPRRLKLWEQLRTARRWASFATYHLNPRRPPLSGEQLMKRMQTMTEKYGVGWQFCKKAECGKRIIEILKGE